MVEGRGNAWRAPLEVQYMCPGLCLSLSVYVRLCFCEYTSVCVSVLLCSTSPLPRSKWRERLAVPDQQVTSDHQAGNEWLQSDIKTKKYLDLFESSFLNSLKFQSWLQVTQSSPNTPLMARKLKSKSRNQSSSPIR